MTQGLSVEGMNFWVDPAPAEEGGLRLVRLALQVRRPEEGALVPFRVPLVVRVWGGPIVRRVVAVGILQGTVAHGFVDLRLPPANYLVTSTKDLQFRSAFRLAEAPAPACGICGHSPLHPSELHMLAQPGEDGEEGFMGMQEMLIRACCLEHLSFLKATRVGLYELGVYYPLKGSLRMVVEGKETLVRPGEYLVENPLALVSLSASQSWPIHFRHAFFPQRALRRLRNELGLASSLGPFDFSSAPRPKTGGIDEALRLWESAYRQSAEYGRRDLMKLAAQWLMIRLLQEHPNGLIAKSPPSVPGRVDPRARAARRWFERHAHEQISLGQMAKEMGLSGRSLERVFHAEVGMTPRAYLRRLRIERAKLMIRERSDTLADIALSVGYRDLRSFCRAFKQETQTTPRTFR